MCHGGGGRDHSGGFGSGIPPGQFAEVQPPAMKEY